MKKVLSLFLVFVFLFGLTGALKVSAGVIDLAR